MRNSKYAFTRPDGGVSILIVAADKAEIEAMLGLGPGIGPDGKPTYGMTDEEYEAHILEGIPKDALDVQKLPDDWEAPDKDRTFRNAWRQKAGVFSVDMAHAREITRSLISSPLTPTGEEMLANAKTPDELRSILNRGGNGVARGESLKRR